MLRLKAVVGREVHLRHVGGCGAGQQSSDVAEGVLRAVVLLPCERLCEHPVARRSHLLLSPGAQCCCQCRHLLIREDRLVSLSTRRRRGARGRPRGARGRPGAFSGVATPRRHETAPSQPPDLLLDEARDVLLGEGRGGAVEGALLNGVPGLGRAGAGRGGRHAQRHAAAPLGGPGRARGVGLQFQRPLQRQRHGGAVRCGGGLAYCGGLT